MISFLRRVSKQVVLGILCSILIATIVGIYHGMKNSKGDRVVVGKAQNRTKRGTLDTADVLSLDDKKFMLQTHNDNRRAVSPQASDMREMIWDDDLAKMAVAWSRRCEYVHSTNPGGENLALDRYNRDIRFTINNAIDSWDVEKNYYDFQSNVCEAVCGHYTQEVWATTYKVGCGTTSCDDIAVGFGQGTWPKAKMTVCSYIGAGNAIGEWPYQQGTPCSKCPADWTCNEGLCQSPTEKSNFGLPGSKGQKQGTSKVLVMTFTIVTQVLHSVNKIA